MPRASSDGNLHEMRAIQSRTKTSSFYYDDAASSKVLERSRLHQGGSNGGFGGRGGDGGAGGDGGGGGGSVDGYYEEMIQRYPGDALLLANYARFLKEVKGDERKAEEYCERAMLSEDGRDGEMLSMYGDLIWKNHGDGARAQSYFDQAVQAAPDDSYVLASYAKFLWDSEEEDEEEEREMVIGYPTDVQHVGHIGWDGMNKVGGMVNAFSLPSSLSLRQLEMAMEAAHA